MILTPKQEQGLQIAVQRYKDKEPYTVIAGYAGVGKSTLIKFIVAALDLHPNYVSYISYTGKAAQVLRNKGCPNAMTAHKLLYKSIPDKNGNYIHIPVGSLYPYKLIVVDEVSMLPKIMWELLLSHKVHVIALGDPGQLPPVAAENNCVLDHPHIFLDEVMRQAAESEIIRLSMDVRNNGVLQLQRGKEVRVVDRNEILLPGFFSWADQIICGKNETRYKINDGMRKKKFGEDLCTEPQIGDKLICLHNDWDRTNSNGDALVNGLTGELTNIVYIDPPNNNPWMEKTPIIDFLPEYEGADSFNKLEIDYKLITQHQATVTRGPGGTWRTIPKVFHPHEFDYGYCITCHKSQGSEFDKVIVLEEFMRNETRDYHIKWLYTAITRAAQKLIIVKNYHPF